MATRDPTVMITNPPVTTNHRLDLDDLVVWQFRCNSTIFL